VEKEINNTTALNNLAKEDVEALLERDPVALMFAVWDAEDAEVANGDDRPPGEGPRELREPTAKQPRRRKATRLRCCPSCLCHIPFAVGDRVRTNLFLPAATGTVERLGKRMPRHSSGHYVYVRFDAGSRLPPSLADRRHALYGGFDLVPEGGTDPFAPRTDAALAA
jgi:hypothetical protein